MENFFAMVPSAGSDPEYGILQQDKICRRAIAPGAFRHHWDSAKKAGKVDRGSFSGKKIQTFSKNRLHNSNFVLYYKTYTRGSSSVG